MERYADGADYGTKTWALDPKEGPGKDETLQLYFKR